MYRLPISAKRLNHLAQKLLLLRNRHFLLIDLIICACTPTLALLLRIEKVNQLVHYVPSLMGYTLGALGIRLVIFFALGLYRR
jgi:hypothetical protein